MNFRWLRISFATLLFAVGSFAVGLTSSALDESAAFAPPPEPIGELGTYWLVSRTNWPPLPYNPFPELPLHELENGGFLVDDSEVDYEALWEAYQMEVALQQMEGQYGLESESGDGPPPPNGDGGEGGGYDPPELPPPAFLTTTQPALLPPFFTNLTATLLTATNTLPNAMYDLFSVTNLGLTNWTWLDRGGPGQTNWYLSGVPEPESYYQLGTMLDTDGDGLTDAHEGLTSKTNPLLADTDGDGWSDWYELAVSLTDPLTPESVPSLSSRQMVTCAIP